MNVDLPQAVAGSRAQRRALMDACEELWASGEYIMTSSRFPFGERQMRSLLGSLARRGVLKWEEQSEGAGAYRVEFQSPESEDSLNIASLNLRQLQNMVDRRQDALRELFSKPRGPEEIWDFLEEYFSRNSRDPREAFVREAVVRGLTPQQREAVEASPRQPLLINAAAGTGKTHVLARRLLLLQAVEHIDGDKILVLSFSRAGARAIGERIDQLAKELGLKPVRAMTFHSFCYSILKMQGNDAKLVGAKPVPPRLRSGNDYLDNLQLNEVLVDLYDQILKDEPASSSRAENPPQKILDYCEVLDSIRSGHPDLDRVILDPDDLLAPGTPRL